jgi:hypothetical protein
LEKDGKVAKDFEDLALYLIDMLGLEYHRQESIGN